MMYCPATMQRFLRVCKHDSIYAFSFFLDGQTSSGKTFTMEGANIRDPITKGIIPRSIEALFAGVSNADENIEFCFKASYIEIYMEKVKYMLSLFLYNSD